MALTDTLSLSWQISQRQELQIGSFDQYSQADQRHLSQSSDTAKETKMCCLFGLRMGLIPEHKGELGQPDGYIASA